MDAIGLYLHIPFCRSKCKYCDFYSLTDLSLQKAYVDALLSQMKIYAHRLRRPAKTLYFGGGTPSLLGGDAIAALTRAAKELFGPQEITLECNPGAALYDTLCRASDAGVNRVSLGVQSVDGATLAALGRTHIVPQVIGAVEDAKRAGIDNISLDIMLGLPGQTIASLQPTLDFCAEAGVQHVSAYLLKVEPGTPLALEQPVLPDEDETADLYEFACKTLEKAGFLQYEISNFARPGRESRHNLIYWNCEEYLGLGPAAHSFLEGRRFFYPRDLKAFLAGQDPAEEGEGGTFAEYAMLRLRLTEGLTEEGVQRRFGFEIPREMRNKADPLVRAGLAQTDDTGIRLTRKGMLVQNSILTYLL